MKPDMQKDRALAACSIPARHLFNGLITQADDDGRQDVDPHLIKAAWYPFDDDVSNNQVVEWRDELAANGLLNLYEIGGVLYGELPGFADNQVIRKPTPSKIPPPPSNPSPNAGSVLVTHPSDTGNTSVGTEGKGMEGIGMEDIYTPAAGGPF